MNSEFTTIKKSAPSNIAIVKYWGKHGIQLPNNPSISMSLQQSRTDTNISYKTSNRGFQLSYYFENKQNESFQKKIRTYLEGLFEELPFIQKLELKIESFNTFPHSTGIASSASSMAALALGLVELESQWNPNNSKSEQIKRASFLARLGSGSAARSVYPGWVSWGQISNFKETSDYYASPIEQEIHPLFTLMGDAVLIVSSQKKAVSSTLGHQLMNTHPFAEARYTQAKENVIQLLEIIKNGDFDAFAQIAETEALTLHFFLMTSSEDGLLLKPNSIQIIDRIRQFRKSQHIPVCFTIDAGPNIHLLYPLSEREKVLEFIENELTPFCENQKWIDDQIANDTSEQKY